MDDWNIKKGHVYKKMGFWQKGGSETEVSKRQKNQRGERERESE